MSRRLVFAVEGEDRGGFVCAHRVEKHHTRGLSSWERGSAAYFSDCAGALLRQGFSFLRNGKILRSCLKTVKVTKIFNFNQLLVFKSCRHSKRS